MPEVVGIDKLLSHAPQQRFGRFNQFGTSQFGFSVYGDEDIFIYFTQYGESRFGVDPYANILLLSGIYRRDNVTGKVRYYREPFYITKNPRTVPQQAHRHKYGLAVGEWRALTLPEKEVYNTKAKGKRYSGWNLFYKKYLESH